MICNDRRRSPTACRRPSPIVTDHMGTRLYSHVGTLQKLLFISLYQEQVILSTSILKVFLAASQPSAVKVRLAGKTVLPNQGRVEVNYNGTWGTVCDEGWDKRDADVVCRMLGFSHALRAAYNAAFGPGIGAILLTKVRCVGDENSIIDCGRGGWDVSSCGHLQDAGVVCGMGR